MLDEARCSLFGGEAVADGLERNEKKEEERVGAGDDVDAVGVWLIRVGRDIPEDPFLSSSSLSADQDQGGVVTTAGSCTIVNHPTTMGVKSLWKLLTPVGRPVLYFFLNASFCESVLTSPKA